MYENIKIKYAICAYCAKFKCASCMTANHASVGWVSVVGG